MFWRIKVQAKVSGCSFLFLGIFFQCFLLPLLLNFCDNRKYVVDWGHCSKYINSPIFDEFLSWYGWSCRSIKNSMQNSIAFIIFQCCPIVTCCSAINCAITQCMVIVKTRAINILCKRSSILCSKNNN